MSSKLEKGIGNVRGYLRWSNASSQVIGQFEGIVAANSETIGALKQQIENLLLGVQPIGMNELQQIISDQNITIENLVKQLEIETEKLQDLEIDYRELQSNLQG